MMPPDLDESLRQANDPRTPPPRLAELARVYDRDVQRAVASNPSTPLDTLLALLGAWPDEVTGNAALDLYRLSDPLFLSRAAVDTRSRWAAGKTTPSWALAQLASDADRVVRKAVARHERCPPDRLAQLARDPQSAVRQAAASNPRHASTAATAP